MILNRGIMSVLLTAPVCQPFLFTSDASLSAFAGWRGHLLSSMGSRYFYFASSIIISLLLAMNFVMASGVRGWLLMRARS